MSPEEAVRRIKNHNEVHSRKEKHFAVHITEALNMAVEALEKQIPKKVIFQSDFEGLRYCPCCNVRFIGWGMKYCGECGQALDWSDTE